jgi:hypothetical protein
MKKMNEKYYSQREQHVSIIIREENKIKTIEVFLQ